MNYSFLNKSLLALFIVHAGAALGAPEVVVSTATVQPQGITKAIAAVPKAVWTKISNNPTKSIIVALALAGVIVWYNISQEENDEEVKCLY